MICKSKTSSSIALSSRVQLVTLRHSLPHHSQHSLNDQHGPAFVPHTFSLHSLTLFLDLAQPVIDGKKWACSACIKGHRSSACQHTVSLHTPLNQHNGFLRTSRWQNRPIFEIKKKGRPPTQCLKCRQMRKATGLHAKCLCLERPIDRLSFLPLPTIAS